MTNQSKMESQKVIEQASLYVGDLHPDVTEQMLHDIFKPYGTILSIRLCRDIVTSTSLEYAYVNFQFTKEAKEAMENMNFEPICGRTCRIMWNERNPYSRRSNFGNIFIKNLDKSITAKELYDTFEHFGEIASCKLETNNNGMSKGFAFVSYKNEDDALKAIETIDGKSIRDKIVHVGKFIPKAQRLGKEENFTNCYIKNFSNYLNETSLKDHLGAFGEINSVKINVDASGDTRGSGFVDFKNHCDAVKAIKGLNGTKIEDKIIYVGRALNAKERQKKLTKEGNSAATNLYVKYLHKSVNDERLKEMFSLFGKVCSAKIMIDNEKNISKGFGFVSFSTSDEASRAIDKMNGQIVDGHPLYVGMAQNKEQRASTLSSLFDQKMHKLRAVRVNEAIMKMQFGASTSE